LISNESSAPGTIFDGVLRNEFIHRSVGESSEEEDELDDAQANTRKRWREASKRYSTSASSSGVLFSTSDAHLHYRSRPYQMGEGGSAGVGTAVDVVELVTRLPIEAYAKGGSYYKSQQRATLIWYLVFLLLCAAGLGMVRTGLFIEVRLSEYDILTVWGSQIASAVNV